MSPVNATAAVPQKRPTIVSMFSGCGGLDLGFIQAGFQVVWANDIERDACRTYRRNIGEIIQGDVAQVPMPVVHDLDVLTAGFPCQPFSNAGNRFGICDSRGQLYRYCFGFVDHLKPKIVMFENVRGLVSIKGEKGYLLDEICDELHHRGYEVHLKLVNASDYGVPQNRLRVIIVGVVQNRGLGSFRFPRKVTGVDLRLGTILDVPLDLPNQNDLIRLNPQAVRLGSLVPEGGSWKDIPYELLPDRLKRIRDDIRRYRWPNFYRRFSRDEIAGTITAAFKPENAGVWHPVENRVLSAREIARIQSFPDDFVFEAETVKGIYQMIGNAVPPKLAKAFAEVFVEILTGKNYVNEEPLVPYSTVRRAGRPIRPDGPEMIWDGRGKNVSVCRYDQAALPFASAQES